MSFKDFKALSVAEHAVIGFECFHCAEWVALPEDFGCVVSSLDFWGDFLPVL